MEGTIHLEVVTPDGVKLAADVSEFTAPSVDGEFGVLPGHVPLLAALTTGIVSYVLDGEKHAVAVGPGFAEVADDVLRVLDQVPRPPAHDRDAQEDTGDHAGDREGEDQAASSGWSLKR